YQGPEYSSAGPQEQVVRRTQKKPPPRSKRLHSEASGDGPRPSSGLAVTFPHSAGTGAAQSMSVLSGLGWGRIGRMSEAQTLPHPLGEFPQPRRRWRLWLGVPLLLLLLLLGGSYGLFIYWSWRGVRGATAEAERDMPEGWQLEDIEAHRAQVPDGEN